MTSATSKPRAGEHTPKTDAEVVRRNYGHDLIPADFARKLEADRARLIDLLNRSQNIRPGLLLVLGYVPEPVLELCNEARALLREMEG